MANFFIDRPIFAWVLAILLCLTGTLAIFSLPVEQYPDLAPPNVRVTANYPGASAQTLENTVTQVIEQNMTGLDNLMYMSSQSSGTGQASVTLSFKAGTDPDEAVQQVQNQQINGGPGGIEKSDDSRAGQELAKVCQVGEGAHGPFFGAAQAGIEGRGEDPSIQFASQTNAKVNQEPAASPFRKGDPGQQKESNG